MRHHGSEMLTLSSLSIIFVVLMQTINGALQGLGKVAAPVIALAVRNNYKICIECEFNANNRDKWSNYCINNKSNHIYHYSFYSFEKKCGYKV